MAGTLYNRVLLPGMDPNEYPEPEEYEFGTNTGRQGTFNPKDAKQHQLAVQRLQELQNMWGDRLDPNYTGDTGYNDMDTYAKHKNEVVEAQNIMRILQNKDPMDVEFGGMSKAPAYPGIGANQAHRTQQLRAMDALHGYNTWQPGKGYYGG